MANRGYGEFQVDLFGDYLDRHCRQKRSANYKRGLAGASWSSLLSHLENTVSARLAENLPSISKLDDTGIHYMFRLKLRMTSGMS
jgi:hypothetical protein